MTTTGSTDLEKLVRSRKRWRIATAAVAAIGLWLLHGAGATIGHERMVAQQQHQEIVLLKQKLGEAATEMKKMSAVMTQSQKLIELFGRQGPGAPTAQAIPASGTTRDGARPRVDSVPPPNR